MGLLVTEFEPYSAGMQKEGERAQHRKLSLLAVPVIGTQATGARHQNKPHTLKPCSDSLGESASLCAVLLFTVSYSFYRFRLSATILGPLAIYLIKVVPAAAVISNQREDGASTEETHASQTRTLKTVMPLFCTTNLHNTVIGATAAAAPILCALKPAP